MTVFRKPISVILDSNIVKNGKTLLSGIDPIRRADKTADAVSVKERTLFLCPSPLYGYGISRLLSRLENETKGCAVLCMEADPELYELTLNNIDPSLVKNKNFKLTNICKAEELLALISAQWGELSFRRVEMIKFTGGWQLFPEIYESVCESLRDEIATGWSNALTLTKFGRLYIRNALRNIRLVSRFSSVDSLSFGDETVLVLGAGPSLDDILDKIKAERRFKIICVDTCLGALKDRGIVPDLVVILESQHWNLRDFIGCGGWNVKTAVDLSSLPATAENLSGGGYLFFTPWTKLRIFERLRRAGLLPAVFPPLGSVGLSAVELARRLTRGRIICVGIDFSYTADKYHARSTPGHRGRLNAQTRLRRIFNTAAFGSSSIAAISKTGLPVYTGAIMKNYRSLFENEFASDPRIFDIESTGLPLGLKTLSMNEAMDMLKIENEKFPQTSNQRFGEDAEDAQGKGEFSSSMRFSRQQCLCEKNSELNHFFESEKNRLMELRGILTGENVTDKERLNILIDECDYIWSHFPDCAGGRKPDPKDVSFLKRVRAEIDPMLKLFNAI